MMIISACKRKEADNDVYYYFYFFVFAFTNVSVYFVSNNVANYKKNPPRPPQFATFS